MPKPLHPVIIIQAGTREGRSGIPTLLAQRPGVEVQISSLPLGDYLLEGSPVCVIERKTHIDFVVSIVDHHLFDQFVCRQLQLPVVVIVC